MSAQYRLPGVQSADVDDTFRDAAGAYGDPAGMLSDNEAVFTGRSRRGGRVALEVTLDERGIRFRHSRPYHPQTCGKVERFHQTLKKWLAHQPRAATIADLQAQLDAFRDLPQHRSTAPGAGPAHPDPRGH